MIESLKRILGLGPKTNYAQLLEQGATIVDVRTKGEFSSGHINGSKNIPLNSLAQNLKKVGDKNKPVITCCASGMRSASAKNILKSAGFTEVHNGGGWRNLQNKIG
ncbi:rhodanese-like domain-containing protein [Salinimicrobium sp. MT39]|uniref:Rhodanese-like domain-containing protein n=1 Tax=Salinimicrobium profundisediminis TaxID=2994553 RepID=A0A9X3CYU1_9FLAO|nr:rhodanese-like domain-containing protein [Salinimicrobium profundisediminis]MCX2839263.1 rhodanese-like domain-containing protein [Salinimicrobium profundisediminis]